MILSLLLLSAKILYPETPSKIVIVTAETKDKIALVIIFEFLRRMVISNKGMYFGGKCFLSAPPQATSIVFLSQVIWILVQPIQPSFEPESRKKVSNGGIVALILPWEKGVLLVMARNAFKPSKYVAILLLINW